MELPFTKRGRMQQYAIEQDVYLRVQYSDYCTAKFQERDDRLMDWDSWLQKDGLQHMKTYREVFGYDGYSGLID